jgi:hypothetical protein
MISVRLCGGLGNQLFQYATARRLAHKLGAELLLDTGWYEHRPSADTPREFELLHYAIDVNLPNAWEKLAFRSYGGRILRRLPLPRPWPRYRERSFAFDPAVLALPDGSYLDGYWQSAKYFDDIGSVLRRELTPAVAPGPEDQQVIHAMSRGVAVAVHVRRGDYVSHQAAAANHGLCSVDYYRAAIAAIAAQVPDAHYFVFSDDPAWTRETLRFPGPATFVDHNAAATAFQDLRLMSLCRHHIVANSSFSWWGAYLASHPAQQVIAPARWFAHGGDTADLIPAGWQRI